MCVELGVVELGLQHNQLVLRRTYATIDVFLIPSASHTITSYYKRANCKTALGLSQEAITDLENVLRLNPQHYEANFNIGGLYFDAKSYNKAAESYQKAVSIYPKSDNGFYRLAETYQKMSMKTAALKNCQRALQINPNNEYAKKLMMVLR